MTLFPEDPDRDKLNFAVLAEEVFSYLISDFGYRLVYKEQLLLRYESDTMFVIVSHDRMEYHLGVFLGFLNKQEGTDGKQYSIEAIIKANPEFDDKHFNGFMASSAESVKSCIIKLGELTKAYAGEALRGRLEIFAKVDENDRARSRGFMIDQTRGQAHEAWKNRNFLLAAELLGSIRSSLTPCEEKKRLYARKRASIYVKMPEE